MNRCAPNTDTALVRYSLGFVPARILERVGGVDLLIGVDAVFAGANILEETGDGRAYRDTAHVLYPRHLRHRPAMDRTTTVVLPEADDLLPKTIVHEFGHVLQERLGLLDYVAVPVTKYGQTHEWEAFAEAFTAWAFPPLDDDWHYGYQRARDLLYEVDPGTVWLFEELAAE